MDRSYLNEFQKNFVASAIGSSISSIMLNPIVMVKVRYQNGTMSQLTPISIIRSIYRNDGILGFWNGTKAALLQIIPSSVIYMTMYEYFKTAFAESSSLSEYSAFHPILAASMSRFLSVSIISPIELIRTIQVGGIDKSLAGIAGDVVRTTSLRVTGKDNISFRGLFGLYRGWKSTIMRDVPYSALYWWVFESVKPIVNAQFEKSCGDQLTLPSTFVSASIAGVCAATVTHPFDVVKTQFQLAQVHVGDKYANGVLVDPETIKQSKTVAGVSHIGTFRLLGLKLRDSKLFGGLYSALFSHKNENSCCICCKDYYLQKQFCSSSRSNSTPTMTMILRTLYNENGIVKGLYRGLSMRLMTVIPSGGIMLTVYEAMKKQL